MMSISAPIARSTGFKTSDMLTWDFSADLDGVDSIDDLVLRLRGIADTIEAFGFLGCFLDGPINEGVAPLVVG